MSWLAENCPRLHRATQQERAIARAREARRRAKSTQLLHLQRLVAHRELQLIRAEAKGQSRYIRVRRGKLDTALHALGHVQQDVRNVDVWEPRWAT